MSSSSRSPFVLALLIVCATVGSAHSAVQGVDVVSGDPKDWPMYNRDAEGTRWSFAENKLRPSNIGQAQVLWSFPTSGAVAGTPAVVKDVVYAVDSDGIVYALERDGTLRWMNDTIFIPSLLGIKTTNSLLVTNRTVIFGDTAGQIHGLDVDTGALRWTTRPGCGALFPNGHPVQAIFGAGTWVGPYVAYGISSYEWAAPLIDPGYEGYTFRGSVVLIDPASGHVVWQTFLVGETEAQPGGGYGPSGASVWGTPAYDKPTKTLFVGTSNNYSPPATGTSDALIALDAIDGSIKWVRQMTPDDTWNMSFLPISPDDPPDSDFGDSPQLYRVQGKLLVSAGQKNGVFHVVDGATGESVETPRQYLPGGLLGGFHMDSAHAGGVNYASANRWADPFSPDPPEGGSVFAISWDGAEELWRYDSAAPILAGVAVANGVVYAQSIDGILHAIDASTGEPLLQLASGGQSSGPSISRGRIYLGAGDILTSLFAVFPAPEGGAITCIGLPD